MICIMHINVLDNATTTLHEQELQAKIDEQSSLQEVPEGQLIFGISDFARKDVHRMCQSPFEKE